MKVLHVFTILGTPKAFFDGQFAFLSKNGVEQYLITADEPDADFNSRNSLNYKRADVARKIDIKADIRAIKEIRRYIKENNFDIVVGHTPKGAMVSMIASYLAGTKRRVYFRHGLIYTTASGLKRFVLKTVERFTALLSTHIVNVSPSLSELAKKDRLNGAKKQRVIGLGTCGGIDTFQRFNPSNLSLEKIENLRNKLEINQEELVFGFVGRLCNDKGIPELVEAFELFRKKHPDIQSKLLLVGRFDTRDALSDYIKNKILNHQDIISTGSVDQSTLPSYYSLMDAFLFPSHREGFGMTVIEASAMQIPVAVSRAHGCVDTIISEKTGIYIGLTPEEILKGMERLLDLDFRKNLGKEGRIHVVNNYDHKILRPMHLAFYNEIMS